jgi:2-(1,2-epoxy-1,2-dihydrophenyl)acetyl-CoA isomerase
MTRGGIMVSRKKGPDMPVDFELTDSVAHVYLNRPHRLNAVVPELTEALIAALGRAGRDGARVVVLAGRGRAFCSGHDLKEQLPPETVLATRLRVDRIQEVTRAIRRFPGPVIAAVHGYALGAGCEFALGCDLVVAAEDAQFGFPEVSVGLSVTGGISRLLPLLVGPVRAKELLLLGERFGAARALELGLINKVAPAGEHEQVAGELAARLRDQPELALALAKQALDRGADCALEEAMATETDFATLTVSPAARGATADAS